MGGRDQNKNLVLSNELIKPNFCYDCQFESMVLPRPHFEQNLSFANQRERIFLPCTQRIMELKNLILFSVVFGAFVCFFVLKFLLA